jgi:4-amino-4-deoxy-L-arabinose transferase-like glycosyltransferase
MLTSTKRALLLLVLCVALLLRLGYALAQDARAPFTDTGGDTAWYLETGYDLLRGDDFSHLPPAPMYLIVAGAAQVLLPPADGLFVHPTADSLMALGSRIAPVAPLAMVALRVVQALLATFTCYCAYRLALRVTDDTRAGLIAAAVIAVSPAFIIETSHITTETLFIFFIAAGMTVYVEMIAAGRRTAAGLIGAGVLFALATLTRAVALAFPLGLALHLLLVYGWRVGFKRAAALLLVYGLTVSTWTIYNIVRFDRFVIGAEGLAAFLYIGATEWSSPAEVDAQLAEDASQAPAIDASLEERQTAYVDAAANVIGRDPLGYIGRRVSELAGAYAQPYGTVFFPGESLRELAAGWWREDRSLSGLLALAQGDAFWQKLTVYLFHYAGLALGLVGMWLLRRNWRVTLPLVGYIAYTTLVHLALLALPRYLFPTSIFWWVLAAGALSHFVHRLVYNRGVMRKNYGETIYPRKS